MDVSVSVRLHSVAAGPSSYGTTFSSCSATYFNDWLTSTYTHVTQCIDNTNTAVGLNSTYCGDGILEGSEECDIGFQTDACCNSATCRFASGATCWSRDVCCNSQCQFRPASDNYVC